MAKTDNETPKAYFDLHITGVGYINRIREFTPEGGTPFLRVSIAALWGRTEEAVKTWFECRVSGKQTQDLIRKLKPAVEEEKKVLAAFTLSDLSPETFTYTATGKTGIRLESRLIRLSWVRVEGQPFHTPSVRKTEKV